MDDDKCTVDGCPNHTEYGVVGIRDGRVDHRLYCKTHYYQYKMNTDGMTPKPKKKKPTSKVEKEFKNAGLRVQAKNSGTQLVLTKKYTKVDYWPTTQKWYNRTTGESGVGKKGVFTNFGL